MSASELLAVVAGVVAASWILISVIRTVVLPRPERVWLTMLSFDVARRMSLALAKRFPSAKSHRILGVFAPTVLVLLPLVWSLGLIAAFASIYWGADVGTLRESIELSGSSLTTLGIADTPRFPISLIVIIQALVGLSILALMIGFLPTLYGTFSSREVAVGRLTTRAGSPPVPASFVARLHEIGRLAHISELWEDWEDWFVELGETHTTFPALIFFRSSHQERHWLAAAETALDTAALVDAARLIPTQGHAATMIRSGYLAIRAVADFYQIAPELTPGSHDQLSIDRSDFDRLLNDLERRGIELQRNRDDIWIDFAGWRINYDKSLPGLADLIGLVPSHWDHIAPPVEETS